MTTQQMRQWLIDYYEKRRPSHQSGSVWIAKVNRMGDAQIFAIYTRINNQQSRRDEYPATRAS